MISSIYNVYYSVRNSLDKLKVLINLYLLPDDGRQTSSETKLGKYQRLVTITGIYHV